MEICSLSFSKSFSFDLTDKINFSFYNVFLIYAFSSNFDIKTDKCLVLSCFRVNYHNCKSGVSKHYGIS